MQSLVPEDARRLPGTRYPSRSDSTTGRQSYANVDVGPLKVLERTS
jgi:hypothetical protein